MCESVRSKFIHIIRKDAPKQRTERDKSGRKNSKIKLPGRFHENQFTRAQSLTPYILHSHTRTHAHTNTAMSPTENRTQIE